VVSPLRSGDVPNGRSPTHFCTSSWLISLGITGKKTSKLVIFAFYYLYNIIILKHYFKYLQDN